MDSDKMAREFSMTFSNMVLTKGQELILRYEQNEKSYIFKLTVKTIEGATMSNKGEPLAPSEVKLFYYI